MCKKLTELLKIKYRNIAAYFCQLHPVFNLKRRFRCQQINASNVFFKHQLKMLSIMYRIFNIIQIIFFANSSYPCSVLSMS